MIPLRKVKFNLLLIFLTHPEGDVAFNRNPWSPYIPTPKGWDIK